MPGMDDQSLRPDATGSDRTANRLPTYTVGEMAAMLGISTDAVRARVNRGTLHGRKVAGVWQVRPPDDWPLADAMESDRPDPSGVRPDATGHRPDSPDPASTSALLGHLHHLEGEVEYLRTELAKRSQELATERERADVLQREALGRIEAIEASASAAGTSKVETYRVAKDASATGLLERLKRWIREAE